MPGRSVVLSLLLLSSRSAPRFRRKHHRAKSAARSSTASGLAVPGVTVTLTNQATNVARVVQTNEVGLYVISAIPPGTYDLKAELAGFRTVERQGLVVQVGSANRIAFTMDVGEPRRRPDRRGVNRR